MTTTSSIEPSALGRARAAAMRRLGRFRRRGRIPFVQQLHATECGAACLAMVLGYHGKTVSLADIREVSGVDRDGTNAKRIVQTARSYGLRARGVALDVDQLGFLQPATVLHWGFDHFVVFERMRSGAVDIVDPSLGRRRISLDELRNRFTGVALLFEPGESFEPKDEGGTRLLPRVWRVLEYTGHLPRILVTSLLLQLFALALPMLTGVVVDRIVPRSDEHLLLILAMGFTALVIFFFLASMIRGHLLLQLRTLFDTRMTLDFLEHLVKLPYGFFQRRSTGDLLARVNSNTTIREIFTSGALSGLLDGTLVTLYLILLLWASTEIGLVVVALAAAQAAVVILSRRRQRELMAQNLHIQARADSRLVELISGIETVKVLGCEQLTVSHWTNLFVDVLNVSLQRGRLDALVDSLRSTLQLASPLLVLSYGAVLVLRGELTLGTMLGLNALAAGFFMPLSSLMSTAGRLQLLSSYIDRIDDVMQAAPEQDGTQMQSTPTLRGAIELERIGFRYGPMAPLVVDDVSAVIEPGELVAIVGRSGSGKSTLARLLLGLYPPTKGSIRYDNIDVSHCELRSLRRQMGVVTQRPCLFGGTIRENIAMAEPSVSLEQVAAAARKAYIHDDIATMPLRYDTPLVDGGASLSGGQQQRIALARALVSNPAILVLDEATSALDAVTEAQVQQSLASLECTRIVVAHRLSTIINADKILVMEEGRLIEAGTHQELLDNGGAYASLIAAQLGTDRDDKSTS